MSAKKWMVQLEKHRDRIGKERDALAETLDEMQALKENCDDAYDNITRAIDALSELT